MAHIDVFQYYDNLVATGMAEPQAKEQARAFNAALDGLTTKEDLSNSVGILRNDMLVGFEHQRKEFSAQMEALRKDISLDIKLLEVKMVSQFRYVYAMGAVIVAVCVVPIVQGWLKIKGA